MSITWSAARMISRVVLDDDDGVAEIAQRDQRREQARVVALVQPDRRLVEDVEHAGQPRADLGREADALALAARERRGAAVDASGSRARRRSGSRAARAGPSGSAARSPSPAGRASRPSRKRERPRGSAAPTRRRCCGRRPARSAPRGAAACRRRSGQRASATRPSISSRSQAVRVSRCRRSSSGMMPGERPAARAAAARAGTRDLLVARAVRGAPCASPRAAPRTACRAGTGSARRAPRRLSSSPGSARATTGASAVRQRLRRLGDDQRRVEAALHAEPAARRDTRRAGC